MSGNSDFNYSREYRGRVKAAVLDWSGTTADAYVIAPAVVFVEVFKNQGVEISMLEARGPMGLRKDLHIKALTEDPVLERELLALGDIGRLNLGPVPTNRIQWDQPHEGNIFESLFQQRAFQREPFVAVGAMA